MTRTSRNLERASARAASALLQGATVGTPSKYLGCWQRKIKWLRVGELGSSQRGACRGDFRYFGKATPATFATRARLLARIEYVEAVASRPLIVTGDNAIAYGVSLGLGFPPSLPGGGLRRKWPNPLPALLGEMKVLR